MARDISLLIESNSLRRQMAEKARTWVTTEFSLDRLARQTEAVYLDALSGKRADPGCM
jgi:glycosyltransferase involved in cell wall biosynthesis